MMDNTVDLLGGMDECVTAEVTDAGAGVASTTLSSSPQDPAVTAQAPASSGSNVDLLFGDPTTTSTEHIRPDPSVSIEVENVVDDQEAGYVAAAADATTSSGSENKNQRPELKRNDLDNESRSDSFLDFAQPPPSSSEEPEAVGPAESQSVPTGDKAGDDELADLLHPPIDVSGTTDNCASKAQQSLHVSINLLDFGNGDVQSSSLSSPTVADLVPSPFPQQDSEPTEIPNSGNDLLLDIPSVETATATPTESDLLGLQPTLDHRDSFAPIVEAEITPTNDLFQSFVSPPAAGLDSSISVAVGGRDERIQQQIEQPKTLPYIEGIPPSLDLSSIEKQTECGAKMKDRSHSGQRIAQSPGETIVKIVPEAPLAPVSTGTTVEGNQLTTGNSNTENKTETASKNLAGTLLPKASPPENMTEAQHVTWLEKELQAAHRLITQLQHHENSNIKADAGISPADTVMVELQSSLENEMRKRAEAENELRLAKANVQTLEQRLNNLQDESDSKQTMLAQDLEKLAGEKLKLLKELEAIREERDEQARKEMALTTRLNDAKKKEAVKQNATEYYEEQFDQLQKQVEDVKSQLEATTKEREQLKKELGEWKKYAERRTKQLETELNDERKLNEERKRKMKSFVEAKTEEVRASKADNISLQTELDQTSASLKEFNQRYKQLHAQWVQSQTRNRELQRDMMKMKKDSEKMTKVGGTLEAKLSRSAQESEDHKNKRIQAKHELMSVLGQLETEKEINNRLREAIKMTFTPKALSQQQTIRETMEDFEAALIKLSNRLGKPLAPPPTRDFLVDSAISSLHDVDGDDVDAIVDGQLFGSSNLSDVNTKRVLEKLGEETQRVSRAIVELSSSVERMHALVDGAGPRSCVDAFQSILLSGGAISGGPNSSSRNSSDERVAINRK